MMEIFDSSVSVVNNKLEDLDNHIDFLHIKISELEDRLDRLEHEQKCQK